MKILIVDDEPINRILLLNMLNAEGYEDCIEAENGSQAIEKFKSESPDLILLDVIMPDMSGFDVVPQLRKHTSKEYLPILFITALEDKASLVKCLEVGGNDFATKPFDKHILIAKIRAHLKIRALSQRIEQQNKALLLFNQRVAREHAIVEHIFSNAIVNDPRVASYFDYCIKPADSFNGDLFLCEKSLSGGIYFVVGDFTGHGLASAVGALPVTRAFQEMSQQGVTVAEIARELNNILLKFLPHDMFMAAVIGEIDLTGSHITLWQGGMPAVILTGKMASELRQRPSRHMALGILDDDEFDMACDTVHLAHNEQLIIVSDGLIEVMDSKKNMLLEDGINDVIKTKLVNNEVITAQALYESALFFNVNDSFDDDVSAVIFSAQPIQLLPTVKSQLGLPSTHEVALTADLLKQPDVLQRVLQIAGQCEGVQSIRSVLYTVLSELFNNALEHGVLKLNSEMKSTSEGFHAYYELREAALKKLDEANITIRIKSLPSEQKIQVSVMDSGEGFDWDSLKNVNNDESFGRGLAMVHALCSKVGFEDGGRKVTCVIETGPC